MREEVNARNNEWLATLPGESRNFTSIDESGTDTSGNQFYAVKEKLHDMLDKVSPELTTASTADNIASQNTLVEETLSLKVGAQVMLVQVSLAARHSQIHGFTACREQNLADRFLMNGAIGKVVAFANPSDLDSEVAHQSASDRSTTALLQPVHEGDDEMNWMTGHAQSETCELQTVLDGQRKVDLSGVELALSGATDRERQVLHLAAMKEREIPLGPYPVVEFSNRRRLLCVPLDFTVRNAKGQDEATRTQVPLILAWAYVAT